MNVKIRTKFVALFVGRCQMSENTQKCSACAEQIPLGIEVCPFCHTKIVLPPASSVHHETTELIVLPIKGEGINLRLSAVILDIIIINLLYLAGTMAFFLLANGLEALVNFNVQSFLDLYGAGTGITAGLLLWFFYFFLCETLFCATPGKAASSLTVVSKAGGRVRWWQAAVRTLLTPIEYTPLGVIIILATPLKQRLGDLLAGTLVVHKEKISRAEFHSPALKLEFHDGRQVTFAELSEGILYKFGMVRQLFLRGHAPDGSPATITIQGHFFRAEFDLLRLNIERYFNLHFPEKIIVWRLLTVIFAIGTGVALVVFSVLYADRLIALGDTGDPVIPTTVAPIVQAQPTAKPTATKRPLPTNPPEPVEVTFDTIGNYPEGQPVIFVGRLALMGSTRCNALTCGLLLENPSKPSQTITIFVYVGDEPNKMKPLPDSYTKSDIQVQLDDGTFAVVGYRLRITGQVCNTTSDTPCIDDIIKIELYQVQ